jgi:hypothetical protein
MTSYCTSYTTSSGVLNEWMADRDNMQKDQESAPQPLKKQQCEKDMPVFSNSALACDRSGREDDDDIVSTDLPEQ